MIDITGEVEILTAGGVRKFLERYCFEDAPDVSKSDRLLILESIHGIVQSWIPDKGRARHACKLILGWLFGIPEKPLTTMPSSALTGDDWRALNQWYLQRKDTFEFELLMVYNATIDEVRRLEKNPEDQIYLSWAYHRDQSDSIRISEDDWLLREAIEIHGAVFTNYQENESFKQGELL